MSVDLVAAVIQVLSGGAAGAVITLGVNKRKNVKRDKAHEVIKAISPRCEDALETIALLSGRNQNFRAATKMYQLATGELVATSFFENPALHGDKDFVRHFTRGGSFVTRVTRAEVCDPTSAQKTQTTMTSLLAGSRLVVLPSPCAATQIDGIFSRMEDDSYVAFFSLKRVVVVEENRGLVCRGSLAQLLFNYYREVATGIPCL